MVKSIESKIARKIRHKIKKIKNGYDVASSYNDKFFGEYVNIYYCKNGFEGESWEIENDMNINILKYKKELIYDGIWYNEKKYYIYGEFYFKSYNDSSLIKLISYDENLKIKENYKKIDSIINNIVLYGDEIDKKKRQYMNYRLNRKFLDYYDKIYMINSATDSVDSFKRSLKLHFIKINFDECLSENDKKILEL
tara:strand:+ start:176 stop:760 length:585 start_codon:yes stop_codon:yes gene_type:complete